MGSRASLLLWLGMTGCSKLLDIQDVGGPADATPRPGDAIAPPIDQAPQLPACTAQRVVELIGGNGGLAWFTQIWPMPDVVTSFKSPFALDNPASYGQASPDNAHPLYARLYDGDTALWSGVGSKPQPTAFVAGTNETHTSTPTSIVGMLGNDLPGYAASLQASLSPFVQALAFDGAGPFGNGAPVTAASAADGPGALEAAGVPADVAEALAPTSAQLARYNTPNASANELELGAELAFAANAFKAGVVGVVQINAYRDDPHGAFDAGIANVTAHANETAMSLDAFYRDLAAASEAACGTGTGPLSLADNVAMLVLGDTPKDSYNNVGWPDGTAGNGNYFYLRSNGFTKPGWFGQIDAQDTRETFDPATGALDGGDAGTDTAAAQAAALYAISRGNATEVGEITTAPYGGVVAQ